VIDLREKEANKIVGLDCLTIEPGEPGMDNVLVPFEETEQANQQLEGVFCVKLDLCVFFRAR